MPAMALYRESRIAGMARSYGACSITASARA